MTSTRHPALDVLWGKSDAGGHKNLLLQHLLDTAAVAELLWDHYLAAIVKARLDLCVSGGGRAFFALLCGLHDIGKATPAFQTKVKLLAEPLGSIGLFCVPLSRRAQRWHHTCAGAMIVHRGLATAGWSDELRGWIWPLIAGHHGLVPDDGVLLPTRDRRKAQGDGPAWQDAQEALVHAVADALGVDLRDFAEARRPRRAEQLAMSGAIIMADWIASGTHFPGICDPSGVSIAAARERAGRAWAQLGIRGGWSPRPYRAVEDLVALRFDRPARAVQAAAIGLAERMPVPGLLVVEAPTGEGKTELALAAAEVMARRFGADGVFVGMPTQATCDPMFDRVLHWSAQIDREAPVGLLHGKARFNRTWASLQRDVRFDGVDDLGCVDLYGEGTSEVDRPDQAPAEWLLGPKRGLLVPITVGTVDQLLHAATRTKHVMLRHAGLAGRVVILDEVHAYDVYTSQFLFEALRWLADARVPVIVLSATLPPSSRLLLLQAYLQGATVTRDIEIASTDTDGYPAVRSLCVAEGEVRYQELVTPTAQDIRLVQVELCNEGPGDGPDALVAKLVADLAEGGCALVIRNTVSRACQTYRALKEHLDPSEIVLLHARLDAGTRADRTERVLGLLGPEHGARNPGRRYVVVATQLAEQSFDIDVDLLVTDLAPIDLLLQRVGRLHRHRRGTEARPPRLRRPRVVVAGMRHHTDRAPSFPAGSGYVYGRYRLLRAAALVVEAVNGEGWRIPEDVPSLVRRGYGEDEDAPPAWHDQMANARREWLADRDVRRANAQLFLLAGEDELGRPTLAGLHDRASGEPADDDAVAAIVRDGPESVEVVLVRKGTGGYLTLAGRSMGPTGAAVSDPDVAEEVVRATVRLPARPEITAAAKAELSRLSGWDADPWLRKARALELDHTSSATLGGRRFIYDTEYGLIDEAIR